MSEKTDAKEEVKLEGKMAEFVDWVETISVLELSKLVKALECRLGVTAAAPVAVAAAGAPAAGGAEGGAAVEKTEFEVVLASAGGQKIQVIKELRTLTGLGLKEAKELVDAAPKSIKQGASKADAEAMKAKLEGVGAVVEIK